MPSYSQSSWPPPARRRLDRYTGRFETSLKAISEAVARKANVDAVSGIHVDDAYTVFCWAGFTRTPWYFRTEFEVAAGTILIGLARYADTFAALVVGSPVASHSSGDTVSSVICALLIAIGLICAFHGWYRGSYLPSTPQHLTRKRMRCWPWARCDLPEESREADVGD